MKTQSAKKLVLNKETIRTLADNELQTVAGGRFSDNEFCQTLALCPTYFCYTKGKTICPIQNQD